MATTHPTRILALDLGKKRIGAAVTTTGLLVSPLCVIQRKNRDADVKAIGRLAREHKIELLVVGLPRQADDSLTEAGMGMRRFGQRLGKALGLGVEFVDEWETTVEAAEVLLEADLSRKRRKQVVDQAAAAFILERYLAGRGEAS